MFKFLFGKNKGAPVKENQRETIKRALAEINEILDGMAVKPKVVLDFETGLVEMNLPEQMPDEALALPAPVAEVVEETPAKVNGGIEAAPVEKAAA
jgi:hypothetical protein